MATTGQRMSAEALDPVTHRGFGGLEVEPSLLLAVSGGPDSMALMHLAARWAASLAAPPPLHVATVDHRLRPEAAAEAATVAAAAADLGLPHATLVWTDPKPTRRLQERARVARYELLGDHAGRIGASHILTAHHADDQAETVLFRLGRGSGIGGLAGMRRTTPLAPGLWLRRPFLETTKADLVAYCRDNAIAYVEDPSNRDPAFARARLRQHQAMLAQLGLDTPGLVRLARRLARADEALEAEAVRVELGLAPSRSPQGYGADLVTAVDIAPEIALRMLRRAISHVAGQDRVLRLEQLEALADALWIALRSGVPHRATLAGTRVVLNGAGKLTIAKEPPRRRGLAVDRCTAERPD